MAELMSTAKHSHDLYGVSIRVVTFQGGHTEKLPDEVRGQTQYPY